MLLTFIVTVQHSPASAAVSHYNNNHHHHQQQQKHLNNNTRNNNSNSYTTLSFNVGKLWVSLLACPEAAYECNCAISFMLDDWNHAITVFIAHYTLCVSCNLYCTRLCHMTNNNDWQWFVTMWLTTCCSTWPLIQTITLQHSTSSHKILEFKKNKRIYVNTKFSFI